MEAGGSSKGDGALAVAAFFFHPTETKVDAETVLDLFSRQKLELALKLELAKGVLFIFESAWGNSAERTHPIIDPQRKAFFCGQGLYQKRPIRLQFDSICDGWEAGTLNFNDFIGQFFMILETNGQARCTGDDSSFFKVYSDGNLISSSFLALVKLKRDLTWNRDYCELYLEFGFGHPLESFFNEIFVLDGLNEFNLYDLEDRKPKKVVRTPWSENPDYQSALKEHAWELIEVYRGICQEQPAYLGLTGGLDSRLVLAILRAARIETEVFTKGEPQDIDFRISRQIAKELGIDFHHPDERLPGLPMDSFYYWDGPNHWGHDDCESDLAVEKWRAGLAAQVLSGLGIGLYRDIWFHRNAKMSLRTLLLQKYHDTNPDQVVRLAQAAARFMRVSLETPLERGRFDDFHFFFRCSALWGRRISVQGRHSNKFIPMLGTHMYRLCSSLPVEWRYNARFQRDLITGLAPELARFDTTYGYRLSEAKATDFTKESIRRWIPSKLKRALLKHARKPRATNQVNTSTQRRQGLEFLESYAQQTYFSPETTGGGHT